MSDPRRGRCPINGEDQGGAGGQPPVPFFLGLTRLGQPCHPSAIGHGDKADRFGDPPSSQARWPIPKAQARVKGPGPMSRALALSLIGPSAYSRALDERRSGRAGPPRACQRKSGGGPLALDRPTPRCLDWTRPPRPTILVRWPRIHPRATASRPASARAHFQAIKGRWPMFATKRLRRTSIFMRCGDSPTRRSPASAGSARGRSRNIIRKSSRSAGRRASRWSVASSSRKSSMEISRPSSSTSRRRADFKSATRTNCLTARVSPSILATSIWRT